jgi:isopenicillin-N epimerase
VQRIQKPRVESKFRKYWGLKPGTVFLNHGSFGACPKAVLALQNQLRAQMEAEPVQFLWRRYEERLEPARAALARFVGARKQDIVFVTNATSGVNAVARSLELRAGNELLTTCLDYNACRNVMSEVARRAGARLRIAPIPFPLKSEEEIVEAVLRTVTGKTKLALIDHVTSHTAMVLPIERLIRELQARGVEVLVDGAHAPGMLALDIGRLAPDYYTGNLHKWVCAPKGAAFLWVREDKQARVQPAIISHGNNTPRRGFTEFQDRFDWAGTFDPSAWFCVAAALEFMEQRLVGGWRSVYKANRELAINARRVLAEELQVEPPCPETLLGSMATVPLPEPMQGRARTGKIDEEQLRLYDEFGIEVPLMRIGKKERRYFRVSAQLYNSVGEYRYLAEALRMISL